MNKKDVVYLLSMLVMLIIFMVIGVKAEVVTYPVMPIENKIGRLKVFLYVYNDKTELWDRAREETVKNITCDKLRGMGLSDGEYYIEKEEK